MSYKKRIVCLACSRRPGGSCVAGREILPNGYGGWIRPVSRVAGSGISRNERQFSSGGLAAPLDVIEIPMLASAPNAYQTENHTIDASRRWVKIGNLSWGDLHRLEETPRTLWINGASTQHGTNDRIAQIATSQLNNSLVLIRPEHVTVLVETPFPQRRAVRAEFQYQGIDYNLKVTDPPVERLFRERSNGNDRSYRIGRSLYFCVSLAEGHTDGYCYKLIATVFSERPL